MNIGENIKLKRKQNNITQKDLANLLNVSVITIQNYENNRRIPNIEKLKNIATNLNCSLNELLNTDINLLSEFGKNINEYLSDNERYLWTDPYEKPPIEYIFHYKIGIEFNSDGNYSNHDLTILLKKVIELDLNKFYSYYKIYNDLINNFEIQDLSLLDDLLSKYNLSLKILQDDIDNSILSDEIAGPIFINNNAHVIADYSIDNLDNVTYSDAMKAFLKLIDYTKLNSKNDDLKLIGTDLDELTPLFNKICNDIETNLVSILYNRGYLIRKNINIGDKNEK